MTLAVGLVAGCGGDPCADPSPGVACHIAGTGVQGFNDDGRDALESDLYLPSQVKRGPDGRVYIMDFNNQRLRAIEADGTMSTVAGNGWHAFATAGEPAVDSPLENPVDFDFLADGRLVLVSYHDPRVLTVEADGTIGVLAGTGELGVVGDEGDGGPALLASFMQLEGIAVAADGAIHVSDSMAHRVRVIRDGVIATEVGPETVSFPTALALDPVGRLLIADYGHNMIRRLASDGTVDVVAGTGVPSNQGDGMLAIAAPIHGPNGLAAAADGTIFISSREGFRIRRVGPDGIIQTFAGNGERGFSGSGGPALDARFGFLARISLDGDGLLVADQTNSAVWRIRF